MRDDKFSILRINPSTSVEPMSLGYDFLILSSFLSEKGRGGLEWEKCPISVEIKSCPLKSLFCYGECSGHVS